MYVFAFDRMQFLNCNSNRVMEENEVLTKCRPAFDDGNLPVNADNPLCSEQFAKLLK